MKNLDTSNMTIEQIWQHGYEAGKASLSLKEGEYLDENFKLHIVGLGWIIPVSWIQVPEGAVCFLNGFKDCDGAFYSENFKSVYSLKYRAWFDCVLGIETLKENGGTIVWQRHLTRDQFREKLAFMKNGDEIEIDGWKVYFNGGKFGYINNGKGGSTPSLKDVLDHIFEGN